MPMIPSCFRKFLAVAAFLGCAMIAQPASAGCFIHKSGYVPQDVQMDMGDVVIPPGLPVGGVIREKTVAVQLVNGVWSCTHEGGSAYARFFHPAQTAVPNLNNVYATQVPGVGIRITYGHSTFPWTSPQRANAAGYIGGVDFRVELIKTHAKTGTGVIAPQGLFSLAYFDSDTASKPYLTSSFRGQGTTIKNPTCKARAGRNNIVVDFGSVPNTSFTGKGSRQAYRDFEIEIDCPGSGVYEPEYNSRISIRLDANQDESNLPGVLKLSPIAGSATRIGIMIDRNRPYEDPLRFGEPIEIGSTRASDSRWTLGLRASYVQTQDGKVGAGVANGQATFTIQYN